jgi:hypothetical protein
LGQHQQQARSWTGRSRFRDGASYIVVAAGKQAKDNGVDVRK